MKTLEKRTPRTTAEPLFGTSDDIELFVQHFREKRVFIRPVSSVHAAALDAALRSLSPDIILDRAVRGRHQGALFRWPYGVGKSQGEASLGSAQRAHGLFASGKSAFEARGPHIQTSAMTSLVAAVRTATATPLERVYSSLLLIPSKFLCFAESFRSDTLLINVSPDAFSVTVDGVAEPVACTPGCCLYLPPSTTFSLEAKERALVVRISVTPLPPFRAVAQVLSRQLSRDPLWADTFRGILHGSLSDNDGYAVLNRLKLHLRVQLDGLPIDRIADTLRRPEPDSEPNATNLEPQRARSETLYDGKEWEPGGVERRDDDIHIVTYKRSGTTWTQMIMYQLLTDGCMDDIDHIYEFSPYPAFELRHLGSAARINGLAGRRVLKSHLPFSGIYSERGRYIYVCRDGMDVAVSSYYHHINTGNGHLPLELYLDRFLNDKPGWFDHVSEWWRHRAEKNVLFLTYREMQEDLATAIRRIAQFCDIAVTDEIICRAVARCQFSFMKEHEEKFDSNAGAEWLRRVAGGAFLRNGIQGKGAMTLNQAQQEAFRLKYRERLDALMPRLDH